MVSAGAELAAMRRTVIGLQLQARNFETKQAGVARQLERAASEAKMEVQEELEQVRLTHQPCDRWSTLHRPGQTIQAAEGRGWSRGRGRGVRGGGGQLSESFGVKAIGGAESRIRMT